MSRIGLIEIYPITDDRGIQPWRQNERITPISYEYMQHLRTILGDSNQEFLSNKVKEKVLASESYKTSKTKRKNIPELKKYINNPNKTLSKKIISEIDMYGVLINTQQVLFHGGEWPFCKPCIGKTYKTGKILSLTFDPNRARWHANYDAREEGRESELYRGTIWIITFDENSSIKAVIHNYSGNIKYSHKHELEVTIPSEALLQCKEIEDCCGYTLIYIQIQ